MPIVIDGTAWSTVMQMSFKEGSFIDIPAADNFSIMDVSYISFTLFGAVSPAEYTFSVRLLFESCLGTLDLNM